MITNTTPHTIKNTETVCYNCKYKLWLVGLGLGVRCGYEHFTAPSGSKASKPTIIPHLRHTCEKFEFSKQETISNDEKQS
jgi:hypothetical protein